MAARPCVSAHAASGGPSGRMPPAVVTLKGQTEILVRQGWKSRYTVIEGPDIQMLVAEWLDNGNTYSW